MTYEEIQAELAALVVKMTEKGVKLPGASVQICDASCGHVSIDCDYNQKIFNGEYYAFAHGDTLAEQLAAAHAIIDALPSLEEAVIREYLRRIASDIDFATENAIADEYVTPLRGVTCAMTENLLTHEGERT